MNSATVSALTIVNMQQPEHLQVLKTTAQFVSFPLGKMDSQLIEQMKAKLQELGGVGLAAPQVNQPKQILAIYIPEDAALLRERVKPYPMHVMINPSYEAVSGTAISYDFEACYSVPHKAGKVPRYEEIKLSYYDEQGQHHQSVEHGFYARVIQHEIDHLNGVLIVDRLTPDCVQGTMEEMMTLRRAELSEDKRILFDKLIEKKKKAQHE
ncbi:peptide deformylase [Legionella fallonii]|uniref:Peptide deformylase n=1 Tax=Legionella fallonii LLAP-10 TaxID=1212491 RepID=A0A098G3Y2_9GAMM|nr:peptide deformylase [Legionella fallonii]CEG57188.1 Peptide deformylase [Legionella fallonii LLAP-10]